MKKYLSLAAITLVMGMISPAVFAIEDTMIFENIDSQSSLFTKIQETNNSKTPEFHKPSGQELVIEDSQKSYAAKTSPEITTFDKEKIVAVQPGKTLRQKQVEKVAQELREIQY